MAQAFNIYCDESRHLDLPGVLIYDVREVCAIIGNGKNNRRQSRDQDR